MFGEIWHAPVMLHPGGLMWPMKDFVDEPWVDIATYQSAHGDSERNSRWITDGEPGMEWERTKARPQMSIEGPYETAANERNGKPSLFASWRAEMQLPFARTGIRKLKEAFESRVGVRAGEKLALAGGWQVEAETTLGGGDRLVALRHP